MQRLGTQSWRRRTEEQRSAVHTRGACVYKGNTTQQSKAEQRTTATVATATTRAANTDTSPTPDAQDGCYTHHAGNPSMHNHRLQQTRHARKAPPEAHNPTPQRHTRQPRPHKHTQHRRDASLMHSREPTPSPPHRK